MTQVLQECSAYCVLREVEVRKCRKRREVLENLTGDFLVGEVNTANSLAVMAARNSAPLAGVAAALVPLRVYSLVYAVLLLQKCFEAQQNFLVCVQRISGYNGSTCEKTKKLLRFQGRSSNLVNYITIILETHSCTFSLKVTESSSNN